MAEHDVQLRHRPLTGKGERIRESRSDPGKWLIRLVHGEHVWADETDFIVNGEDSLRTGLHQ